MKKRLPFILRNLLCLLLCAALLPAPSVRADLPAFAEDFEGYTALSQLQGSYFGSPSFALTPSGDGQALLVSNRTENYFGYAVNAKAFAGTTIALQAEITLPDAADSDVNTFNATLKTTAPGKDDDYKQVASMAITGSGVCVLSGEYEVPAGCSTYDIYFETTQGVSYVIDNISITIIGGTPVEAGSFAREFDGYPILKDLYADDFRMGVSCEAISHWGNSLSEIGNPDKEALILAQFNSVTFGNELKPAYNMDYTSPEATETNLPFGHNRAAIEMLDWARANGIPVRGHTLVWHSQCEDAVFCIGYKPVYQADGTLDPSCLVDAETMKSRMESYIHHVMEYMYANGYGDVIYAWDVVNEAIEPGSGDNMRRSYWYQTIGPEFLMDAFRFAREASLKYSAEYAALYGIDPADAEAMRSIQPKLFYNDYSEFQPAKRDAILKAVATIAAAGYLDGIGMQGHLSDTTDVASFITALKMYSDAVGEVHITELDVTQSSTGANADYYQGVFYNRFFSALLQAKAEGANLTSVTIWGLTDDNSWKKESSPLIFNGDLTPKTAFEGIVNAKTGEKMPEPEYVAPDFSDGFFDFEESDAASLGFVKRGDGTVVIQSAETHSGSGALRNSGRTANWNGTSFDVSRFIGQTIRVHAWVKTTDAQVKLTADIDGKWPNITAVSTASGQWTELEGRYTVPADLTGLSLYFESNGTADLYIDDVSIKLVGQDETFEGSTHTAIPRGVGHMPTLSLTTDSHRGGHALLVTRDAQEASVKFDISGYVGKTVTVSAFVKTTDEIIRMTLDNEDYYPIEFRADDGWTEISVTMNVPSTQTSAQFYIETSGTADFLVDDVSVRFAEPDYDLSASNIPFTTRWNGAGLLVRTEDEGMPVVVLTKQNETYYGLSFDVTAYLGMEIEVTFDVKTDDTTVKVSGDIDGLWPNYIVAEVQPGVYQTVTGTIRLPKDLTGLKLYIETTGTADLYVANFSVRRI